MLYSNMLKNIAMLTILFFGMMVSNPLAKFEVVPIQLPHITKIDLKQLSCLATNIFYEASGESILGQAAVARVVLNRVAHGFARTPCGVVYQTINVIKPDAETGEDVPVKVCQFSWVCEDKPDPIKTSARYKQAEYIAREVLVNDAYKDVVPKSTLFFHNVLVNPSWPYRKVAEIGNHIFYSKEKRAQ